MNWDDSLSPADHTLPKLEPQTAYILSKIAERRRHGFPLDAADGAGDASSNHSGSCDTNSQSSNARGISSETVTMIQGDIFQNDSWVMTQREQLPQGASRAFCEISIQKEFCILYSTDHISQLSKELYYPETSQKCSKYGVGRLSGSTTPLT